MVFVDVIRQYAILLYSDQYLSMQLYIRFHVPMVSAGGDAFKMIFDVEFLHRHCIITTRPCREVASNANCLPLYMP